MKLHDLNSGPPCYVNSGSCDGHQFVLHWSPARPLALITKAVFRWQEQELMPFTTALKVVKFMEEQYCEKRLDYLEELLNDGQ